MLSKPPSNHSEVPTSRRGFAATLLTKVRNPSQLVKALYLSPSLAPHAILSGGTAESLGESLGVELADPSYFFTERRWREHRRGLGLPEEPIPPHLSLIHDAEPLDCLPRGTVGAVALDIQGCIASVTSTGGRNNKLPGRIGDTPIFGCGFWAEGWQVHGGWIKKIWHNLRRRPAAVGISGTGDGDYFIRQNTASMIAHRVKFGHVSLKRAGKAIIEELRALGGVGGVIALDDRGNVAMAMNCPGMYRGLIREDGRGKTAIFDDDPLSEY